MVAASRGHDKIVRILLSNGADMTTNLNNNEVLAIAKERGHTNVVSVIVAYNHLMTSLTSNDVN